MNLNTVIVKFVDKNGDYSNESKEYAYFSGTKLELFDLVVVEARGFMGIAIVTKVFGLTKSQLDAATRWVITKIDQTHLAELKEKADLYFEIKSKLNTAKEQFEERRIYETLAKEDPEIAKLLAQFKSLISNNLLEEN